MIVQCEKCKTKFRVPDEKVTDAGVKVRCSRCAHVFMVRRPPPPASPPLSSLSSPALGASGRVDLASYAPVAPEASSFGVGYPVPSAVPEPAHSGRPASSVDAMVALGFGASPGEAPTSEVATFVTTLPPGPAGSTPLEAPDVAWSRSDLAASLSLAASAAAPSAPAPSGLAAAVRPVTLPPFGGPSPGVLGGLEPRPPLSPAGGAAGMARALPSFLPNALATAAPLGLDPRPPTGPGTLAGMFDAKLPLSAGPVPGMLEAASLGLEGDPFEARPLTNPGLSSGFELRPLTNPGLSSGLEARPLTNPGLSSGFELRPLTNPGLSSGLEARPRPGASAASWGEAGADDLAEVLGAGASRAPTIPSFEARLAAGPDGASGFFPSATELRPSPGASGGAALPADLGDIPGLLQAQAGVSGVDPFADAEGGGTGGGSVFTGSGYEENDLAPAVPFESLAASASAGAQPRMPPPPAPTLPLARIDVARASPASDPNQAATRVSMSPVFIDRPRAVVPPRRDIYGRWPTLLGVVLGLGVVVAAVVGPGQGQLSRFGPELLGSLIRADHAPALAEQLADVAVRRAHATAYETKSGLRLLVIAGEAKNVGAEALQGIDAVATIYDGLAAGERRQAEVGVPLGEDALYAVRSASDLGEAYAAAHARSDLSARTLAPGASAPFMVVFPEVPPEVSRRTFLVEFRRANRAPGALAP